MWMRASRMTPSAGASWLLAPAFLLLAVTTSAQASKIQTRVSPQKPPWAWTVEERLAQRFDPQAVEARAAAVIAEQETLAERFSGHWEAFEMPEAAKRDATAARDYADVVDGDKTPELFLPSELFDDLFVDGFPPSEVDRAETRGIIERRAAALGFGSDLWDRLGRVSAAYLAVQRERERTARSTPSHVPSVEGAMDAGGLRWCRSRAQAMTAAKKEFGEEPFLRLLYLAVAPGHSRTYRSSDTARHASYLHFLEGGCQRDAARVQH